MNGKVIAFQPGALGSILGGVRDYKLYSGTECVSYRALSVFCHVLSLAVALTFADCRFRERRLVLFSSVLWKKKHTPENSFKQS